MPVRHEPTSASAVRRELALDLSSHGVDDDVIHDATLVASELIGNAIRHGGVNDEEDLDANWTISPAMLLFSIEDSSDALPAMRTVTPDAASGRGLAIIAALSTEWDVEPTRRGKRVWAKVALR